MIVAIEDDDECATGVAKCTATGTTCVNTPGSYECACPDGEVMQKRRDGSEFCRRK